MPLQLYYTPLGGGMQSKQRENRVGVRRWKTAPPGGCKKAAGCLRGGAAAEKTALCQLKAFLRDGSEKPSP